MQIDALAAKIEDREHRAQRIEQGIKMARVSILSRSFPGYMSLTALVPGQLAAGAGEAGWQHRQEVLRRVRPHWLCGRDPDTRGRGLREVGHRHHGQVP